MTELPNASQSQIKAMQKAAEEKYGIAPEMQEEVSEIEAVEPVEESVEESSETSSFAPSLSSKEENMRVLRERSQRAERERDELLKKLQDMESKFSSPHATKQIQEVQEDIEDLTINPDDLAEGKHLFKLVNKIKKLEAKLEQNEKKSYATTAEMQIKREYPDFEKVASYDNLRMLREMDSDLADAIMATTDPYKQLSLAYKMVKKLGIYHEDLYEGDKERAVKNSLKPKPLAAISPQQGESPLSKANAFANGLTDDLKEQLRKEMYAARKQI